MTTPKHIPHSFSVPINLVSRDHCNGCLLVEEETAENAPHEFNCKFFSVALDYIPTADSIIRPDECKAKFGSARGVKETMTITVNEVKWGKVTLLEKIYDGKKGQYMHKCKECDKLFFADKRDNQCPYHDKGDLTVE